MASASDAIKPERFGDGQNFRRWQTKVKFWLMSLDYDGPIPLRNYVKNFYPLGPVWQPSGSAPNKTRSAPSLPASLSFSSASSPQPKSGMSAVFAEISSGKAATQGLKKVTNDMKSKNRTDRSHRTGVVTADGKETRSAPSFISTKGPAKLELQMGRKWVVEHHIGNKSLVIEDCDAKQSVYVYGCKDCVLQVKAKVNNITFDKCTKTGLLFKGVVAACEIVNCNSVEIQCEGSVPTISIDNTSSSQLYLSTESIEASVTTAKSTEINDLVPDANSEGDWVEHSLPLQYIMLSKTGNLQHYHQNKMDTTIAQDHRRHQADPLENPDANLALRSFLKILPDGAFGMASTKKILCNRL
ncbi:hypothetical protein EJB05_48842, partial [Eragrostis curvula]